MPLEIGLKFTRFLMESQRIHLLLMESVEINHTQTQLLLKLMMLGKN